MKTLIKPLFFALSLGLISTTASLAQTSTTPQTTGAAAYESGIYTSANGKLNIALNKQTGGPVDIRLKAADGTVLYSHHLGKNERQYRTRLNLSELADGTYQVEITNGVETTRQTVTLATKQPAAPERIVVTEAIARND